jgi:hypothetical protein
MAGWVADTICSLEPDRQCSQHYEALANILKKIRSLVMPGLSWPATFRFLLSNKDLDARQTAGHEEFLGIKRVALL